jgi:hypothetical protein
VSSFFALILHFFVFGCAECQAAFENTGVILAGICLANNGKMRYRIGRKFAWHLPGIPTVKVRSHGTKTSVHGVFVPFFRLTAGKPREV